MKKIITVYIIASDDKKVTFTTKSKANDSFSFWHHSIIKLLKLIVNMTFFQLLREKVEPRK